MKWVLLMVCISADCPNWARGTDVSVLTSSQAECMFWGLHRSQIFRTPKYDWAFKCSPLKTDVPVEAPHG